MNEVKVSVECTFGVVVKYFKFLDFKRICSSVNIFLVLFFIIVGHGYIAQPHLSFFQICPPTVHKYFQ